MTTLEDLIIRKSDLTFQSASEASIPAGERTSTQIAGLLQAVVEHHAASLLDGAELYVVSVTLDMSGDADADGQVQFTGRIDRKTRTLIFASGTASQNDRHLVKATVVFRIS